MWRQITGKVHDTTDTPWVSPPAEVYFRRDRGSYTASTQYPPDTTVCRVNAQGELVDCRLWVNEEGDLISNYECVVGRDRFTFSLPAGDGSAIALSVLRAGSEPVEEYPQTLITYIEEKISLHNLDPSAHPLISGGGIKVPFAWGDASPKTIATLPANTTVFTARILIVEPFFSGSLQLGDSAIADRYFNLPIEGINQSSDHENYIGLSYVSGTQIRLAINNTNGNSQGKGFVIIEV